MTYGLVQETIDSEFTTKVDSTEEKIGTSRRSREHGCIFFIECWAVKQQTDKCDQKRQISDQN